MSAALLVLLALPAIANANTGGYAMHAWPGCGGGYNSGGWDDAGRVYVPCGNPSTIAVYDEAGALVETIATGRHVSDVAPSADGRFVYLAGAAGPARMVRGADGNWSFDSWAPVDYKAWGNTRMRPGGMFVDTDAHGNVYYAHGAWVDGAPHEVVQFDATGRQVTQFGDWTGGWELGKFHWMLGGVAVSEDGLTAYTVEVGNNRIQVWTRASRTDPFGDPRAFGGTPENNADREGYCDYAGWLGKFAAPYDVGLDRAGNVYVINTTCKQVLKFAPGPGALLANVDVRVNGQDYPRPHGFTVGANGAVYVGENQRALRPHGGALPASGLPPAPAPAPAPAPEQPRDAPAPPAPASPASQQQDAQSQLAEESVVVAAAPAAPAPAPAAARRDRTPPRLWLDRRVQLRALRRSDVARVGARCSERCVLVLEARQGRRLISRRALVLRPGRRVVVQLPMQRAKLRGRAAVTLRVRARDAAGNVRGAVRRVSPRASVLRRAATARRS